MSSEQFFSSIKVVALLLRTMAACGPAFVFAGCAFFIDTSDLTSETPNTSGVDGGTSGVDGGTSGGGVIYGTESSPWAADDPINTPFAGTPGPSAGFDGSKFSANSPSDPWANPVYYEREYVNPSTAVHLTVNCGTDRGFGKSVSFWVPDDFHAQIGSNGYSAGDAVVVRIDGSVVNFYGLGGHGGGTNLLPTTCEFFNIAGINQSAMKRNKNQWGEGFAGPRAPQWAVNMGMIDGYFMSTTKPFRGLVFIVDSATNTPSNCGHATYNYSGYFNGSGNNTGICEGQHFVIPRTTPKPTNLTPEGSYLWDVLVQYGAYNAGSGSNQLEVVRSSPAGTNVPQVTQTQVDNINHDIAVLFYELHFAND